MGEDVLVVTGSTARQSAGREGIPVDSAIVGIIDSMEIMRETENRE
jgi:ethanolamine utilization protein EutN